MAVKLTRQTCGVVILAGGQSRRMGRCKALLEINGESLLSHLCAQLSDFEERWISVNDPVLGKGLPFRPVADIYQNAGPMGGLHAALRSSQKAALLCVSCDMPGMSSQLATLLLDRFPVGLDALICRDGIGRLHPLCGIYAKKTLPQLERHLSAGSYRMQGLLEELHCVYLNTAKLVPDEAFINLNTPEEYQGFLAHKIIKQIDADGVL